MDSNPEKKKQEFAKQQRETEKLKRDDEKQQREAAKQKRAADRKLKRECNLNRKTDFSQRFAALPTEIKTQIIAEVMRVPEEIRLLDLRSSRWKLITPFRRDKDLRAEAKKLHARDNTFSLQLGRYFDKKLGPTLRSLSADFTMKVVGGEVGKLGDLQPWDVRYFAEIQDCFPYLENFTLRVRNLGKITWLAVYTAGTGAWFAKACPALMVAERLTKMETVLGLVRDFKFLQTKARYTPARKNAVFVQKEDGEDDWVLMADPKKYAVTEENTYESRLKMLMDASRAEVSFSEGVSVLDLGPIRIANGKFQLLW